MPERYRIIILPRATDELIGICSHIEKTSPQNASSVAKMLMDAIDSLDQLPHRYELHERRREPSISVRSMAVPPFIIYYRVDDQRHIVRILAIRHGARRQPKHFK